MRLPGLVKLNYSGPWSVAEVWENAGWEQREDQLTWQQYEVAAAGGDQRDRGQGRQAARKVPFIMDRKASRQFLVKLSTLPWSEQRKIKEKLDQTLVVKKSRRSEKLVDPTIRQSGLPARLELRQIGKSIKYMKAQEREAVKEMIGHSIEKELVHGELSGEWEQEFSFVCSVCAIEYDDVLEIMHHKWEAHPHCLVTHVSLREGLQRPPTLLYPQVRLLYCTHVQIIYWQQPGWAVHGLPIPSRPPPTSSCKVQQVLGDLPSSRRSGDSQLPRASPHLWRSPRVGRRVCEEEEEEETVERRGAEAHRENDPEELVPRGDRHGRGESEKAGASSSKGGRACSSRANP